MLVINKGLILRENQNIKVHTFCFDKYNDQIWPKNLVYATIFETQHKKAEKVNSKFYVSVEN